MLRGGAVDGVRGLEERERDECNQDVFIINMYKIVKELTDF